MQISALKTIVVALSVVSVSQLAFAISLPKCPKSNGDLREQSELLHKVVIMGADERKSVADYALGKGFKKNDIPAFEEIFSPTGILECGGAFSTAQLTGANNVITTASHTFFSPDCSQRWDDDPNWCTFQLENHKPVKLDFKSLIANCHRPSRNDWAVVKLAEPIAGAKFYELPGEDTELNSGEPVVTVTGLRLDKYPEKKKTVQQCTIRHAYSGGSVAATHDCDTEPFSSGSAQLQSSGNSFVIRAIHVGGKLKDDPNKTHKGGDYIPSANYNVSVPVNGAFLRAIRQYVPARPTTSASALGN